MLWNCPTPFRLEYLTNLSWFLHRKCLGILLMWVGILYTHKYSQKHKCFLFSILSTSKGVTPVILRQIDSCIAHYRPRCHFITFSESYYSVISILNPLPVILSKIFFWVSPGPPIPYFSKRDKWLLTLIGGKSLKSCDQYTNKMQYKSSFFSLFFHFYVTFTTFI